MATDGEFLQNVDLTALLQVKIQHVHTVCEMSPKKQFYCNNKVLPHLIVKSEFLGYDGANMPMPLYLIT